MKRRAVSSCVSVSCMMFFMLTGHLCAENDSPKTSVLTENIVAKPELEEVDPKILLDYDDALKKGHEAVSAGNNCDAASFFLDARKKLQDNKTLPQTEAVQKKIADAWRLEIDALLNNFSPDTAEKSLNGLRNFVARCSKGDRAIGERICQGDMIQLFLGRIALLRRDKQCVDILRPLADKYRTGTTALSIVSPELVFFYYGLACELNDDYNGAVDNFDLVKNGSLALRAWEHMTFCKIRNGSFDGREKLRTNYDEIKQRVPSFRQKEDASNNLASIDLLEAYCNLKFDSNDSDVLKENVAKLEKILDSKLLGSMQQFHCIVLYDIAGILMTRKQTHLAFRIYEALYVNSTAAEKTEIIAPWLMAWRSFDGNYKADYAVKLVKKHLKEFNTEKVSPEAKLVAAQLLLKNHDYNDAMLLYSQAFRVKKDILYFDDAMMILVNDSSLDTPGKQQKFENLLNAFYGTGARPPEAYTKKGEFTKFFDEQIAALNYETAGDAYQRKEDKLDQYVKAAKCHYKLQNLEALDQVVNKILALDPSNGVLCQRAELARQKGYSMRAHDDWESFARLKNVDRGLKCNALFSNGRLYLEERVPNYQQAFRNFEKIHSEKLSDDIDILLNSALGMVISATHYDDDDRMLQKCVQVLTGEPLASCQSELAGTARLELALFCYYNNKPELASKFMEEIRLKNKGNSQFVEAIVCMTMMMLQRGESEKAISFLNENEQDFKGKSNSCRIYYLWGNILKDKRLYADAILMYQKVEDAKPLLDSDVVQAAVGAHGDCLFALEKYSEAQEKFLKLKGLNGTLNKKLELMTMYKFARCGQMKQPTDDWEESAREYQNILQSRSINELMGNPADVFWVMKAFEEMRILIISHMNDPNCKAFCADVQRRCSDLAKAGICTDYLLNIRKEIENAWNKSYGVR